MECVILPLVNTNVLLVVGDVVQGSSPSLDPFARGGWVDRHPCLSLFRFIILIISLFYDYIRINL